MKKWEYRRAYEPTHRELDALGLDGWELVSVLTRDFGASSTILWFYFKRPITEPKETE